MARDFMAKTGIVLEFWSIKQTETQGSNRRRSELSALLRFNIRGDLPHVKSTQTSIVPQRTGQDRPQKSEILETRLVS